MRTNKYLYTYVIDQFVILLSYNMFVIVTFIVSFVYEYFILSSFDFTVTNDNKQIN